jgi:hypothetical protein
MPGGQQQQPTQTTQYQLSPEQRQLMNLAIPGVAQFAAQTPQRYQGETVAGFTPAQQAAQTSATNAAGSQQQVADTAASVWGGIPASLTPFAGSSDISISPETWAKSAPSLSGAITAATNPLYENLTESALPAIRSAGLGTSGLTTSGSRQGIAEGLATKGTARAAGEVGARMSQAELDALQNLNQQRYATNVQGEGQRYGQNLAALYQMLGLTPTIQGAQTQPAATLSAVGDTQQAMEQAKINAAMNAFNFDQYAPYLKSKDILSLISGIPGGSTVSTGNVPTANPFTQALGGAATGASLGSALFPGIGTGVGAAGGALLPFLFR